VAFIASSKSSCCNCLQFFSSFSISLEIYFFNFKVIYEADLSVALSEDDSLQQDP